MSKISIEVEGKQYYTEEFVTKATNRILELEKEIERLNNIINELEKYLFKQLQLYGGGGIVQEHYDKLQELKESK